jgi:hypothetical protein
MNGTPANDTIPFDEAVRRGKDLKTKRAALHEAEALIQWQLGELADKVEPKYGGETLAELAKELGEETASLKRNRSFYRAWKPNGATWPQSVTYSVLRELATHPDREQLLRDNPEMTVREAQALRRALNGNAESDDGSADHEGGIKPTSEEPTPATPPPATPPEQEKPAKASGAKKKANAEQKPGVPRDIKRWFNDQVVAVNDVINELNEVMANCTPEQHELLNFESEPHLLSEASQNLAKKCAKFEAFVCNSWEEAAAERTREARVRITRAPRPARRASPPVQPEV